MGSTGTLAAIPLTPGRFEASVWLLWTFRRGHYRSAPFVVSRGVNNTSGTMFAEPLCIVMQRDCDLRYGPFGAMIPFGRLARYQANKIDNNCQPQATSPIARVAFLREGASIRATRDAEINNIHGEIPFEPTAETLKVAPRTPEISRVLPDCQTGLLGVHSRTLVRCSHWPTSQRGAVNFSFLHWANHQGLLFPSSSQVSARGTIPQKSGPPLRDMGPIGPLCEPSIVRYKTHLYPANFHNHQYC